MCIKEGMIVNGVIKVDNRVRGVELSLRVEKRKASLGYAKLERGAFRRPPPSPEAG